jgi:hypothetical protein
MSGDDWDWLKTYTSPDIATMTPVSEHPKTKRRRQQHFIKLPWNWIEQLARSRSANTYRVAPHLLYLHWKNNGDPVRLANGMLAMEGVTRFSKWRALRELERWGLIRIERSPRKSPTITVIG